MKTQLLEDIGHSASLSLVPSGRDSDFRSHQGAQRITHTPNAKPAKPRSAFGVWKARPAGEPVDFAAQQQDLPPAPVTILAVVEAIADTDVRTSSSSQAYEAAFPQAVPTPVVTVTQSEPAPPDPVFNFAPSTPAPLAADLSTQYTSWLKRPGQRYLLGGACALSVTLLAIAGGWLYGERKAANTLALVAVESKAQAQFDNGARRRVIAAKEFTLSPDGEVRVMPAATASTPAAVPSTAPAHALVLLGPEPAPATKLEPTPLRADVRPQGEASPKPERVAARASAAPLPRRVRKTAREQLDAAARPARTRAERTAERQLARTSLAPVARKTVQETSKDATLKACKEYGYSAAQCVKRACSVTKYGFVCRGK